MDSAILQSSESPVCVGTAGWSIPSQHAAGFQSEGSHLERYSQVLTCAEINSSFYRPHRPSTYSRWADSTPDRFRFSVKAPKSITHEAALAPAPAQLQTFLDEVRHLGSKLGPILFQLAPRHEFQELRAREFLTMFRELCCDGPAAFEPRNPSWFSPKAEELFRQFNIARVMADPSPSGEAAHPGGSSGLVYYRLHGSPRVYHSSYSEHWLKELACDIPKDSLAADVWCIFDNTASGGAIQNAITLSANLALRRFGSSRIQKASNHAAD